MDEMSNPDSLSPNQLNQALISETFSEFPHFVFVSSSLPEEPVVGSTTDTNGPSDMGAIYEAIKPGMCLTRHF